MSTATIEPTAPTPQQQPLKPAEKATQTDEDSATQPPPAKKKKTAEARCGAR